MGAFRQTPIDETADRIAMGGVLAYPTESCFGLGCVPTRQEAVERILALKGRSSAKGLILIGGAWEHLAPYVGELPEAARIRLRVAWPGPVTFLVPPSEKVPSWIQGSHPRLALRWSAHPHVERLCRAYGGAIVSTSANREGEPPLRRAESVMAAFGKELDGCMIGRVGMRRRPSAIIDAVTGQWFR